MTAPQGQAAERLVTGHPEARALLAAKRHDPADDLPGQPRHLPGRCAGGPAR